MKHFLSAHIRLDALHHAYCLAGFWTSARESKYLDFFDFLESSLGISTHGNPDFWHGQFESLGIDEARQIKEMQQRSAANVGARKVFVISTDTITHEAQNALLKVFEEPTADTHFFLLMPSAEVLLPTLRSRLVLVSMNDGGDAGPTGAISAEQFLAASKGKRMALVKTLAEDKDKRSAIVLFDDLIKKFSKSSKEVQARQKDLEALLMMRSYLNDRSASIKMILEYLALSLE